MKNSSINFIILCAIALSINACRMIPKEITTLTKCDISTPPDNHIKTEKIQALVEQAAQNGLAGVSLLIDDPANGQFYGLAGTADLQSNEPIDSCTKFRVASLTKIFTATAIMLLVEKEQIKLETLIKDLLPSETLKDIKRADEASIRHLLSHTSGIANYDDNPRFPAMILNEPGKPISLMKKLDLVRGQGVTPAWVVEKFGMIYSNTNYLLLQLVIEEITKESLESFIQKSILNPLRMDNTTFSTLETYPENLAKGYIDMYDANYLREVSTWDAQRFHGEGSLISTAIDLGVFFNALLDGYFFEKEETLTMMKTQHLGLLQDSIANTKIIGHDGQAIGYSAEMWYIPETDCKIILLANQGRISEEQPSIEVYEKLLESIIFEVAEQK